MIPTARTPRTADDFQQLPARLRAEVDRALALPAAQQPEWPSAQETRAVLSRLAAAPALVLPSEVDRLRSRLAAVALGRAFLLQGGDCAETFATATEPHVSGNVRTLRKMAAVVARGSGLPVVALGRIAGQYAKPRSDAVDVLGLPVYRGDIVNGPGFSPAARRADPRRLLAAHAHAAATLNMVRALIGAEQVSSPLGDARPAGPDRALRRAAGAGPYRAPLWSEEFYTSHEALLLDYESGLLRWAEGGDGDLPGRLFDLSAHFLWIGERTRQFDGAHLALAALLANPVGLKIGPGTTPADAVRYAEKLDPDRVPGRLTLISRMGCTRIRQVLPPIVSAVAAAGHPVVWQCDPMHGNTFEAANGHKTRRVEHILDEIEGFFAVHRSLGTHPGGLHLELTGDDVAECLGGGRPVEDGDLDGRYETGCDPRLNGHQSLELAFRVAELFGG